MLLAGKIALVTGSSRGIGRAIAVRLAREGASVVINYLNREKEAEEVAAEIEDKGVRAVALRADVTDYVQVEAMARKASQMLGPVQILVNNAMVHRGGKVHKLLLKDWDAVIKASLYGTFYCTRAFLPPMIESRWGRIINISSGVAEHGFPGDAAYGSAKAGQLGFTKSVARELAPYGITVNAVMPGFVMTETTRALSPKNIEKIRNSIPLGRLCTGEDVAELVNFLVARGDHITGSIHRVDGGMGM